MMLQTKVSVGHSCPEANFSKGSRGTTTASMKTKDKQRTDVRADSQGSSPTQPFLLARRGPSHQAVHSAPATAQLLWTPNSMTTSRLPPLTSSAKATPSSPREIGSALKGVHHMEGWANHDDQHPSEGPPVTVAARGGGTSTPEGRGDVDPRLNKAARKRELARRYLSNSLQGTRAMLPDLRRTQSFSVTVGTREQGKTVTGMPRRESGSLGPRRPPHDFFDVRTGVRRTRSLREEDRGRGEDRESSNGSPQHPLSLSLPQTKRGTLSLAALVHELNATVHYSPARRHSFSDDGDDEDDDDDSVAEFDYENGIDPDLCPRLTGQDTAKTMPNRTLTPALRKLNKRRVSSRVRTQQWVNQIEAEQRYNEQRNRAQSETQGSEKHEVALIYEQESQ